VRILVDTNVLVRLRDADDPRHLACVEALQRLQIGAHELCICAQVMIEYWVVVTRPREVNGLNLSPAEAQIDLQELDQLLVCLPEPSDMAPRWRDLATQYGVRGRQAHDARLAALMLAHGVTNLLTLNAADFTRYVGITCLGPQDV
jgi:predicted nucleic acid-binding protein